MFWTINDPPRTPRVISYATKQLLKLHTELFNLFIVIIGA